MSTEGTKEASNQNYTEALKLYQKAVELNSNYDEKELSV